MTPTGVAAFNIGGHTIHKVLNLPVEHGRSTTYHKLASETLHGIRRLWKSVTTNFIDEISMVSYDTLNFVYQRLTEIDVSQCHCYWRLLSTTTCMLEIFQEGSAGQYQKSIHHDILT